MTLLLSNEDIDGILTMEMALQAVKESQLALLAGEAINSPRVDTLAPATSKRVRGTYGLKTMNGIYPGYGVGAVRINSDVLYWPEIAGHVRRDRLPNDEGRWNGLILLFSTETGEPLMISPDGYISRYRVGATNGLAARCLAREDSKVLALFGSGWQAGGQLRAICAVRPIEQVRVFSPNEENRIQFCENHRAHVSASLIPVDSPEAAVVGADIIASATNSMEPTLAPSWLEEGIHFSAVKVREVGLPLLTSVDVAVMFSKNPATTRPQLHVMKTVEDTPERNPGWWAQRDAPVWSKIIELPQILAGNSRGRETQSQTTLFVNNVGQGLQFVALAKKVYDEAIKRGCGHQFPTAWFTQNVHP